MPPYDPASSDSADPDSDSPEVVSRSSARAQTQRKRAALQSFHAEQKGRAKTRNRERDIQGKKKKKEEEEEEAQSRAGMTVEDGSDLGHQSGEQSRRLEERMRKAMADANDEEAGSAADDDDDDDADDDVRMGLADGAELETDSVTGDDSAEHGDSDDDSDDSEEQRFITGRGNRRYHNSVNQSKLFAGTSVRFPRTPAIVSSSSAVYQRQSQKQGASGRPQAATIWHERCHCGWENRAHTQRDETLTPTNTAVGTRQQVHEARSCVEQISSSISCRFNTATWEKPAQTVGTPCSTPGRFAHIHWLGSGSPLCAPKLG